MDKIQNSQRNKRKISTHLSLYKTKYFNLKKKHRLMSWFTKGIKSHESVPLENNSPSTSTGNSSNNKFINNHVIRNVQTIGTQTATFSKHDNICQTEIPTRRNHSTQCDKTENKAKYNNIDGFDVKIFSTFYRYLSSNGQLKDFISLVEGLINNKIQSKNMAWKAALHMGRYAQCKSTTGMRYDSDYVEFLSLLYLLFGGSALNVIRGPVLFCISSRWQSNDILLWSCIIQM